jgi:hypothetical protein
MKYTSSLFLTEKDLVEAYTKKVKDVQASGIVGNEYEGNIDGKLVKLWLPDGVKRQYKAVIEAESFLHSAINTSVDDAFSLRMKIWDLAKEHMLVDGNEACNMDDDSFTVDFIEQVIVVYLGEILFPLYHRSCTRAKEVLANSLTKYMSLPVSI